MAIIYPVTIGLGERKLKIQKNGTDIATFSANEQNVANDEPMIANITVPTTASDLSYSNTTSGLTADDVQEALDEIACSEIIDTEPYVLRQGLGDMVDMELVGGSFAWNQLVQNGNFANGTSGWTINVSSTQISASNNVLTIIADSNNGGVYHYMDGSANIVGHKVLFLADVKCTNDAKIGTNNTTVVNISASENYQKIGFIGQISNTARDAVIIYSRVNGSSNTINARNVMYKDLTQDMGPSIADAIYAMEQATSGSGVAFFRKYFPKDYYAYDSGSIQSVCVSGRKVVGKNVCPFEVDVKVNSGTTWIDPIPVIGGKTITVSLDVERISGITISNTTINLFRYKQVDSNGSEISTSLFGTLILTDSSPTTRVSTTITLNANTREIVFDLTNYNGDSNVNTRKFNFMVEYGSATETSYEPYEEHVYPFDTTKQLRGKLSLVNNKLVYDGDIWNAKGITRKYKIATVEEIIASCGTGYRQTAGGRYEMGADSVIIFPLAKTVGTGYGSLIGIANRVYTLGDNGAAYNNDFVIGTHWMSFNSAITTRDDALAYLRSINLTVVYELATPTIESASPFQNPQRSYTDGTEEFVDYGVESSTRDVSIPVGHNSTYKSSDVIQPLEDYVDGATSILQEYNKDYLKSKNLLDLSILESVSTTGFTAINNHDSSWSISGQNTSSFYVEVLTLPQTFPAGTYTLSFSKTDPSFDSTKFEFRPFLSVDGNTAAFVRIPIDTPYVVTAKSSLVITKAALWHDTNVVTFKGKVGLQIEKGSKATQFVPRIKSNLELDTDKISSSAIVDNLTTNDATKVLSAKQGKALNDNKLSLSDRAIKVLEVIRGSSTSTSRNGFWASMANSNSTGSPILPTSNKWWHVLSMDWDSNTDNWVSQLALATQDGSGVWWRRNNSTGTEIDSSTWHRLAEGNSYGDALKSVADKNGNDITTTYLPLSGGTLSGPNVVKFTADKTTAVNYDSRSLSQLPISKYKWHDLFAFCKKGGPTFYVSADNTNWTESTVDKQLFSELESTAVNIIKATGQCGARWIWDNNSYAWCNAKWLLIGNIQVNNAATITITFETSSDGTNWTVRHQSSTYIQNVYTYCYLEDFGGEYRFRLTITKDASNTTDICNINSIKLLTPRLAGQGGGRELEYPYVWDKDGNISSISAGNLNLGASNNYWKNGYFTNINGVAVGNSPKFTDTTYSAVSKTANGLCPQLPNETATSKFLRQDGTWAEPSSGGSIAYSTTKTAVGTWIDGRTIYKQTFEETVTTAGTTVDIVIGQNVHFIIEGSASYILNYDLTQPFTSHSHQNYLCDLTRLPESASNKLYCKDILYNGMGTSGPCTVKIWIPNYASQGASNVEAKLYLTVMFVEGSSS